MCGVARQDEAVATSMHKAPEMFSKAHVSCGDVSPSFEPGQGTLPATEIRAGTARFLITLDQGIG